MAAEDKSEEEMEKINSTIISSFTTTDIRDVISLLGLISNILDKNIQAEDHPFNVSELSFNDFEREYIDTIDEGDPKRRPSKRLIEKMMNFLGLIRDLFKHPDMLKNKQKLLMLYSKIVLFTQEQEYYKIMKRLELELERDKDNPLLLEKYNEDIKIALEKYKEVIYTRKRIFLEIEKLNLSKNERELEKLQESNEIKKGEVRELMNEVPSQYPGDYRYYKRLLVELNKEIEDLDHMIKKKKKLLKI